MVTWRGRSQDNPSENPLNLIPLPIKVLPGVSVSNHLNIKMQQLKIESTKLDFTSLPNLIKETKVEILNGIYPSQIDSMKTINTEIIFEFIYKKKGVYIISRNRLASFIVDFPGLWVSNLLLLNVRNIQDLIYNKLDTEFRIIKQRRPNQLISLGDDAQRLLNNDFYDDVALILKDKEDNDPVFTAEKHPTIPLHRVTLTRSLNNTLKYSSGEFHKNITCHSFRATFITEGIMKRSLYTWCKKL